jgi:predicted AlkP superfamily pyrophosphatase or phosphodiesterase
VSAGKVVLVVVDGLKLDTAVSHMGFMEELVTSGSARRWAMRCALPSLSKPLYETIHTGVAPVDHGILDNHDHRSSGGDHIFAIARRNGRITAASAFAWMFELYNGRPYDPAAHGATDDPALPLQYGRFYDHDEYADEAVVDDALRLTSLYRPDYLLVHPMGCDDKGHRFGGRSAEYRDTAGHIDRLLAEAVPSWLAAGYAVLVTSDHGMNDDGTHGGDSDDETLIPFYAVGCPDTGAVSETASQLSVAPTVLALMGLPIPRRASAPPLCATISTAGL